MYSLTLVLHSSWRWVVLVLVVVATWRGIIGTRQARAWTDFDRRVSRISTIGLDVQMLLGLLLFLFLSPFTLKAFKDFGAAMRTPELRYWAVEHMTTMVAAVIVAHVGSVMVRKGAPDAARHLRSAIFFGIVVLLLLFGTPWPGLPNGRPLFRFGM